MTRTKAAQGFTLVEVLVSLVVLSVGMLGIAGLYVAGLRSGASSIYRMQAISLSGDLADRIRANRTANVAYAGAAADDNCVNGGVDCSPDQMAATDLFYWQQQLAITLPPGATGEVAVVLDGLVYDYQIKVTWTEPGQTDPSTYTLNLQI